MTAVSSDADDAKGRARTRRKLIRAAYFVFAQHGYGATNVTMVCEAAGFTRGAFYSNFTSLEELFIAVWRYHVQWIMDKLASVVDSYVVQGADYSKLIEMAVRSIPVNERWEQVNGDFIALCTRTPELNETGRDAQQMLLANMLPTVMHVLEAAGRRVTAPEALGYALLAVHEGTASYCVIDPQNPVMMQNRFDLLTATLNMFSEPMNEAAPAT